MPDAHDVEALVAGVLEGDRRSLARAITLVESSAEDAPEAASRLLAGVYAKSDAALRISVSGPPGAGKSTLIDALGRDALDRGERVAVLCVDPSSSFTGGSLLGDRLRMERLSQDPRSFIRPTPTRGVLGGVARRTREASLLCAAAGYGLVVIETVGVGQSEQAASALVDCFVLVVAPSLGDEVQGMKRGILEVADVVAVNKADGPERAKAERARSDLLGAFRLFGRGMQPPPSVLLVSALERTGTGELYDAVQTFVAEAKRSGAFVRRRAEQRLRWLREEFDAGVRALFQRDARLRRAIEQAEARVGAGENPLELVRELLEGLGSPRAD